MPSANGRDDLVRVFDPAEKLRVLIGPFDEAVDGGLPGEDGVENAAFEPAIGQLGRETLDGIYDEEVGVKWEVKRSYRPSHHTLGDSIIRWRDARHAGDAHDLTGADALGR